MRFSEAASTMWGIRRHGSRARRGRGLDNSLLAEEVIWVVGNHVVSPAGFHLSHNAANFPSGPVGRVVKKYEAARFQKLVDITKVAFDELVGMIAINVTEADRST